VFEDSTEEDEDEEDGAHGLPSTLGGYLGFLLGGGNGGDSDDDSEEEAGEEEEDGAVAASSAASGAATLLERTVRGHGTGAHAGLSPAERHYLACTTEPLDESLLVAAKASQPPLPPAARAGLPLLKHRAPECPWALQCDDPGAVPGAPVPPTKGTAAAFGSGVLLGSYTLPLSAAGTVRRPA
jgi:hypothetical protein